MYGRMLLWAIKSDVLLQKENDMFKFEFIYPNVRLVIKKMPLMLLFFFLACMYHCTTKLNSINEQWILFEHSLLTMLRRVIIIHCSNKSMNLC